MSKEGMLCGISNWKTALLVLSLAGAIVPAAPAQTRALERELEAVYQGWARAMATRNVALWKQYTASHRQADAYNLVVSRKGKWPHALFQLPFGIPDISSLNYLTTNREGPTANMIYLGRVDFGVTDRTILPENILVLKFVREEAGWKFDNTQYVNLGNDREVLEQARARDPEFLRDPLFQPPGTVPETPELVPVPDYAGDVWLAAIGYKLKVTIGDQHVSRAENGIVTDMIYGGLHRSGSPIVVEAEPIDLPDGAERRLEVAVYAIREGKPAHRVWHFKPEPPEEPVTHKAKVYANAVTIPGG